MLSITFYLITKKQNKKAVGTVFERSAKLKFKKDNFNFQV